MGHGTQPADRLYEKNLADPPNFVKTQKVHAQQIQGRVFSEVGEAPQAADTHTHPAGRPKILQRETNIEQK